MHSHTRKLVTGPGMVPLSLRLAGDAYVFYGTSQDAIEGEWDEEEKDGSAAKRVRLRKGTRHEQTGVSVLCETLSNEFKSDPLQTAMLKYAAVS